MLPGVMAVEGTGQERGSQMAELDQPDSLNKKVTVPPEGSPHISAFWDTQHGLQASSHLCVASCVSLRPTGVFRMVILFPSYLSMLGTFQVVTLV